MPDTETDKTETKTPPMTKTTRVEVIKPDKDDPQSIYEPDGDTFTTELDNILDILGKGLDVDSLKKEVSISAEPKEKKAPEFEMSPLEGKIFEASHTNLKPGEFLAKAMDLASKAHPVDLILFLSSVSDKSDYMRLENRVHHDEKAVSGNRVYPLKDSVLAEIVQMKSPAVMSLKEPLRGKFEKELFDKLGMRACLFIPLLSGGSRSGVLVLAGREENQFADAGTDLEWIASGLSLALERSRLATEHEKQNQILELIKQMNRLIGSSAFEIEKVFKITMDRLRSIFDVDAGLLYVKEKEKLKTAVSFNTNTDSIKNFRQKIGSRIAGIVVSKGKPLIVNDTQKSTKTGADNTSQKVLNTRSILCVPLITQNKAVGAIELISKANIGFSTVDDALLNSVATSLSLALLLRKR